MLNRGSEVQTLIPMTKSHSKWKEIFETDLDDLTTLICPKEITTERVKTQLNKNQEDILPLVRKHKTQYMIYVMG